MDLRPLACWNCGFESRRGHRILSVAIVVCCQVEVRRSPISECVCVSLRVNKCNSNHLQLQLVGRRYRNKKGKKQESDTRTGFSLSISVFAFSVAFITAPYSFIQPPMLYDRSK